MKITLLHLNIWYGKFLNNIISYVREHDIDILQFQEVASGKWTDDETNHFRLIKEELNYEGEIAISFQLQYEPASFLGNATFFKPTFAVEEKSVLWLKEFFELTDTKNNTIEELPRNALTVTLAKEGKRITTVNTHLVWGPDPFDAEYKRQQHEILILHMKKLQKPFILSGDFNVIPDTHVVRALSNIAKNLPETLNYPNTLNPNTHKAQHLFPAGYPVDYIFTSDDVKVTNFSLVDKPDLSDHFGYYAEFEI